MYADYTNTCTEKQTEFEPFFFFTLSNQNEQKHDCHISLKHYLNPLICGVCVRCVKMIFHPKSAKKTAAPRNANVNAYILPGSNLAEIKTP